MRRIVIRVLAAAGLSGACAAAETPAAAPGPACEALMQAAARGGRCDPALASLAAVVADEPDEAACRSAVRRILGRGPAQGARVHSVYEPDPWADDTPLDPAELAAIAALRMPATLRIAPDVGRVPGIPPTLATLDGQSLDSDGAGRLSTTVTAGAHTVHLRHAGRESSWCLQLRACEALEVVAHGAQLARHPDAKLGACDSAGVAK